MDKTKIIPIVLLIVILGIGFVAFTFYSQKQVLESAKVRLEKDNENLLKDFNALKYRYNNIEKTKSDLERKLTAVKGELSRLEDEKSTLRRELLEVSKQRDLLVENTRKPSAVKLQPAHPMAESGGSDGHWADFVREKAGLAAKLDDLSKALFDEKSRIFELNKENKELSIKIDQLAKEKQRLTEEVRFKERTTRILSMDLVNEREAKTAAVSELKKLRNENITLKRELILANKEQIEIQKDFKEALEKKNLLERKIEEAENILKDKFLVFEELQSQLKSTIEAGKKITAAEGTSVELPPIVVKSSSVSLKGLRGEVIAVNREEKFVVVDIGELTGLRPGTLLRIMRGDKDIAVVEVIETRKEISAANIKETISGSTIQEGDIAVSK